MLGMRTSAGGEGVAMASDSDELVGVSRGDPTPEDELWLEAAKESLRKSGERLQDSLQKLVPLAAALAGGGMLAVREDLMDVGWRAVAVLALILAAASAFYGSLPVGGRPRLQFVNECREYEARVIRVKSSWLIVAAACFFGGLLCAFAGTIARYSGHWCGSTHS